MTLHFCIQHNNEQIKQTHSQGNAKTYSKFYAPILEPPPITKILNTDATSPADVIKRWSREAKAYDEAKQNESCARFHKMGTRAAVTLDDTKQKKKKKKKLRLIYVKSER